MSTLNYFSTGLTREQVDMLNELYGQLASEIVKLGRVAFEAGEMLKASPLPPLPPRLPMSEHIQRHRDALQTEITRVNRHGLTRRGIL